MALSRVVHEISDVEKCGDLEIVVKGVGLGGWLRNETVYLPEGSHPSQY